MTKQVAKKEDNLPAMAMDFQADAGAGYEEADKDAYAIPFINILQALSPQVDESDGAYIEGAKPGMFFNTVTNDIFSGDGVEIIPVHFSRGYIEWGLRENGGGFKAEHSVADASALLKESVRDEKNRDVLPNGNHLVDTRNHYAIIKTESGWAPVIISMTSTQIKKSRKWMTAMNQIQINDGDRPYNPPMFANLYKMSTVKEKNDQGSWFGYKLERQGFVEDNNVYQLAKQFREQILSGEAKAAHESVDEIPGFEESSSVSM